MPQSYGSSLPSWMGAQENWRDRKIAGLPKDDGEAVSILEGDVMVKKRDVGRNFQSQSKQGGDHV